MSETEVLPEVKEIVGAMLFAAKQPLTVKQMRATFPRAAMNYGGIVEDYAKVKDADIKRALEELGKDYEKAKVGLSVVEVATGYRLQNEKKTGPWLRELLDKGKPNRLSKPALETLSIVAYRQPCTRSEIEAVRGVAVDAMVRNLLEMGLVKVTGRSELPGRPWLFGTTQMFLEHFGLKQLDELPNMDELRRQGEQISMKLQEQQELKDAADKQDESDGEEPAEKKGDKNEKAPEKEEQAAAEKGESTKAEAEPATKSDDSDAAPAAATDKSGEEE
jgi:segregation and condensation protein B